MSLEQGNPTPALKPTDIPVFILAGGLGTRLTEETHARPKPMVEIGDAPILLHLMRHYYAFGFNNFVICAGYRAWDIKNFFLNYQFKLNHLDIDHRSKTDSLPQTLGNNVGQERWRVRVLDTGLNCMTGSRIARGYDLVKSYEPFDHFAVTYGDGLSNVNLLEELRFHEQHKKMGTVLAVRHLQARFGVLNLGDKGQINGFLEKPQDRDEWINGGFFIFKKDFRSYLSSDGNCIMERSPLEKLAGADELVGFKHGGFWYAMDTLRDKIQLESLWESGKAPWITQNIEKPLPKLSKRTESDLPPEGIRPS